MIRSSRSDNFVPGPPITQNWSFTPCLGATYRGGTWTVTAWQATLTIASDYLSPRCPARTVQMHVTGGQHN